MTHQDTVILSLIWFEHDKTLCYPDLTAVTIHKHDATLVSIFFSSSTESYLRHHCQRDAPRGILLSINTVQIYEPRVCRI